MASLALAHPGWEITIAATSRQDNAWLAGVARHTPDAFILPNIVRLLDQPRFLRYPIASRQADAVALDGSLMGELLIPYLRARSPSLPFAYVHNEEYNSLAGVGSEQRVLHAAPDVPVGEMCARQAVAYMRPAGTLTPEPAWVTPTAHGPAYGSGREAFAQGNTPT
jgi:hypothetical protein